MAKQGEDRRDNTLFDMSLGDGMIEVNEAPTPPESPSTTPKPTENKSNEGDDEKKVDRTVGGVTYYEDGSFEINESFESNESEEDSASIESTDNKKDEQDQGKKTPSADGSSDSSSSSPYLAFARDRANEGVFLEFNDEDWKVLVERNEGDEAAALRELSAISIEEMVKTGVESYKNSLTPEERSLYEAKEKGIPVDEYAIAKGNFNKYSKIKEDDLSENVELQEELVSKALELRGFTPDEIKEEIEGYKALENLESKAGKALKGLPGVYKKQMEDLEEGAKAQEKARQDNIRQRVARMKRTVDNTPEIIPGIKLTKPTREKIMESMTTPVAKDETGNPLNPVMATRAKNPEAFEMMVHYYHSLGLFNIDDDGQLNPDFSKIAKTEKTKTVDSFRSAFEQKEKPVQGKASIPKAQQDELDEFDQAFRRL